jgi:hypothetical protein
MNALKQFTVVSYKGMYLGTPNHLFSFVDQRHAQLVRSKLVYENFRITQKNRSIHLITQPTKVMKPLNRKKLSIQTMDPDIGAYFAKVNNMGIELIDNVRVAPSGTIELVSNLQHIDDLDLMHEWHKVDHIMTLEGAQSHVDYEQRYFNFLLEAYLQIDEGEGEE